MLLNSAYFSEIIYDENRRFFDLYLTFGIKGISENHTITYNDLMKNLNGYLTKISEHIKSTYSNSEKKKADELNKIKLSLSVVEISDYNKDFDTVIICEKEYKYFGIFKKNIGIRTEIKNGRIISMERKSDTLKENTKNVLQHSI